MGQYPGRKDQDHGGEQQPHRSQPERMNPAAPCAPITTANNSATTVPVKARKARGRPSSSPTSSSRAFATRQANVSNSSKLCDGQRPCEERMSSSAHHFV